MLTNVTAWAEFVAGQGADADPRVIHAQQDATRAHQQLQHLTSHHTDQRAALQQSIGEWPLSIEARAIEPWASPRSVETSPLREMSGDDDQVVSEVR